MKPLYIDKSPRKYHSFPYHQHDVWEITVNLAGSGTATIDGREYPFRVGTIFCLGPGILHRKESEDGFIDGSLMLQDFIPMGSAHIYQFEDDVNGSIQFLFSLMFDILMKDGPNAQAVINSLADSMYQLLVSWSAIRNRSQIVERFEKILLDNISNSDFKMTEQIKETGYSCGYFRKIFKSTTGQAPTSYFNRMRVEYAKRQIQQYYGVRTCKEIARSAGFEDPYYFSRVFKQFTGLSPVSYGQEIKLVKAQKADGEPLALGAP